MHAKTHVPFSKTPGSEAAPVCLTNITSRIGISNRGRQ